MMYPGMKARIQKELLEMRPFQSSFQVCVCFGSAKAACDQFSVYCPQTNSSAYNKFGKYLY